MPTAVLDANAESAIRNYLVFLEEPAKLVDQEFINRLRTQAEQATDPIARLKALAELDRAQRPDDTKYKLDFILHARAWAEVNNVGASAFKQLGVKDDVLKSAGLIGADRGRGRKARKQDSPTRGSVSAESIKTYVRSLRGHFTLADLQNSVGGSPMTVRKAVQELVDNGTITRLGPKTDWSGRGRAPIVFDAGS